MADDTRPLDNPDTLESPPRQSVKLTEREETQDESPSESTFTSTVLRVQLSEEERVRVSKRIDDLLTTIKSTRETRGWDANWDVWEDTYFGILQDRAFGQANVHVPISQEIVDTVASVRQQALFTPTPIIGILPREVMDVDVVKRREQFLDYAWKVEMHTEERLDPVGWETDVLGTGVCFLPWLRETDRIRDEETYDGLDVKDVQRFLDRYPDAEKQYPDIARKLRKGQIVHLVVEYTEAIHDAPDPTYIPLRDWIVRDTAKADRLHREPFVGHYIRDLRWDDLVRLEEEGYYDKGSTESLKFIYDRETSERLALSDYEQKSYTVATGILRFVKEGETRERRYLVDYHPESRTILRLLHFPMWHNRVNYIPFYNQRSRKYIYGLSLIQKVEHPQQESNAIHSLLLDILTFSLPMFKAREGMEYKFNPLREGMYPGKTFYMPNPQGDVEQFQMSTPAGVNVLVSLEQVAMRHAELASGSTQNLSGLESARDPQAPATKALAETQQALRRIGRYLSTFSQSLIELAFQTCELYYQFSPKGKVFRVMGEEGVPVFPQISRQELRMRVDYFPHGSTAVLNPDQELKDNMEMATLILKAFPETVADPVKKNELLDMILSSGRPPWAQKKGKLLMRPQELERMRRAKTIKDAMDEQKLSQLETAHKQQRPSQGQPMNGGANGAPGLSQPALA